MQIASNHLHWARNSVAVWGQHEVRCEFHCHSWPDYLTSSKFLSYCYDCVQLTKKLASTWPVWQCLLTTTDNDQYCFLAGRWLFDSQMQLVFDVLFSALFCMTWRLAAPYWEVCCSCSHAATAGSELVITSSWQWCPGSRFLRSYQVSSCRWLGGLLLFC